MSAIPYPSESLFPGGGLFPSSPTPVSFVDQDFATGVAPVQRLAEVTPVTRSVTVAPVSLGAVVSRPVLGATASNAGR